MFSAFFFVHVHDLVVASFSLVLLDLGGVPCIVDILWPCLAGCFEKKSHSCWRFLSVLPKISNHAAIRLEFCQKSNACVKQERDGGS